MRVSDSREERDERRWRRRWERILALGDGEEGSRVEMRARV